MLKLSWNYGSGPFFLTAVLRTQKPQFRAEKNKVAETAVSDRYNPTAFCGSYNSKRLFVQGRELQEPRKYNTPS